MVLVSECKAIGSSPGRTNESQMRQVEHVVTSLLILETETNGTLGFDLLRPLVRARAEESP